MPDYDFSSLNDKEFEILTAQLLSKSFGRRFERFKPGRDAGVDGRYFSGDGRQVVFQCKHWAKSGIEALLRCLKKKERNKVVKLNPRRYILVTSISLSANDKRRIAESFLPYIVKEFDVLGKEDLNDLLCTFPDVERANFKLWLHSAEVLDIFRNGAIVGRSRFTLEQIRDKSDRYVNGKSRTCTQKT